MTVGQLIRELENFDEDMEVRIGMIQRYGSNFAMDIDYDVEEHNVRGFYGGSYRAAIITEGGQCGTVDYNDEDDDYEEDYDEDEEEL